MTVAIPLLGGLGLALAGWILLRRIGAVRSTSAPALLLDLAPVLIGWAVLLGITARPLFAGIVILALAGGLALVDHTKRQVLREPVVFSDASELTQVFTNPELYLPFAPRGLLYGGGAGLAAGAVALLALEPAAWMFRPWVAGLSLLVLLGLIFGLSRPPVLPRAAAQLRRFRPTADPMRDAAAFGTLGTILVYGIIARAERAARRAEARAIAAPPIIGRAPAALPPVVVVQSESFFDARRIGPGVAEALLPTFDALRGDAEASGLLTVPGWGANTMRAEFAVLSGLGDEALGFDRFNPYHAFAHAEIPTLASRFRALGYRTVAIHPYARRFYRRDVIFPRLGFDKFIGVEAFAGAPLLNGYVSDAALAEAASNLVADGVFLFVMSMENHGPWRTDAVNAVDLDLAPGFPADEAHRPLRRYLAGLRSADAMLGTLAAALGGTSGLLAFYGDHLPSLPDCFEALGFEDARTDYLVWRADGGAGLRRDLAAHELSGLIWDAARVGTTLRATPWHCRS